MLQNTIFCFYTTNFSRLPLRSGIYFVFDSIDSLNEVIEDVTAFISSIT